MSRSEVDIAALEADPRVAWVEDVLRFCDTDANGHVNNATFSAFCESGRVHFLHDVLGGGREEETFYAVARLTVDFLAELHFPGRVRTATWLSNLGRTSMTFRQAILDGSGRLAGTSEGVIVTMDFATRRPRPHGEATRALAAPLVRA